MIKFDNSFLPHTQSVIMCSGGVDSIGAIHYLLTHKKKFKFSIFHFNHNIRPQNNVMEIKVEKFCNDFDIEFHCTKALNPGPKTEEMCRHLRIDALKKRFAHHNVITAHHMNDVVEQYLMNCLRGIPCITHPISLISYFGDFAKCHCFLMSEKKDFIQYVKRNKLEEYIEYDESNDVIKGSRRNWIRHKILPELAAAEINLVKTLRKRYE